MNCSIVGTLMIRLGCIAAVASGAGLADGATTDPIGFYAVKVAGADEDGTPSRTYLGVQLMPTTVFQGAVSGVDGSGLAFVFGTPEITDLERVHYVHLISGSNRGYLSDIVSVDSLKLTCSDNLAGIVSVDDVIKVRPHPQLADLFGADNRFGLGSGENAESADNVVMWDAATQQERVFYFNSIRNRWEEKDVDADASQSPMRYPLGFYIVRRAPGTIRIALSGEVASDPVLLPVGQGASVFSLPVNLSASLQNLFPVGDEYLVIAGSSSARADLIDLYEPSTGLRRGPFYLKSGDAGATWSEVGNPSGSLVTNPIDMLSTLVIHRSSVEEGFFRAEGSLAVPAPGTAPVVTADPEVGELPIEVEFPHQIPQPLPPGIALTLESSSDLNNWSEFPYTPRADGRVIFALPAGQSRAFYRINITLLP